MTSIIYTSQAKDDLARINWKIREKIITLISNTTGEEPTKIGFQRMHNSELMRLIYEDHVIIGSIKETTLNIVTVQKKQKMRAPE